MASRTVTLTATKGTWLRRIGSTNYGAGKASDAPVGYTSSSGAIDRHVLGLPALPTLAPGKSRQIHSAKLFLRNDTPHQLTPGGTRKVSVRRVTAAFTPNGSATLSTSGLNFPGPAHSATNEVTSGTLGSGNDVWLDGIDITQLYCDGLPATVLRPNDSACGGGAITGLMLANPGDDMTSTPSTGAMVAANNTEFWSAEASSAHPYVKVVFTDTALPVVALRFYGDTPSDPGVTTGLVTTRTGTHVIVALATVTPIEIAEIRVWPASKTDAQISAGTGAALVTKHTWQRPFPGEPRPVALRVDVGSLAAYLNNHITTQPEAFTPLAKRTGYRIQAQITSKDGVRSLWTPVLDALVTTNAQPIIVTPRITSTTTPTYSASISDPDSTLGGTNGQVSAGRVLVKVTTSSGTTQVMDSGKVDASGTGFAIAHSGDALTAGVVYTAQMWLWDDADVMSEPTGLLSFTPSATVGPTLTPGDTSTKQSTRNPSITIAASSFDGYQRRFYRKQGDGFAAAPFHDSGPVSLTATTSTAVATPTGLFAWGETFGVDARVRPAGTGTFGEYCPIAPIYINAMPAAPEPPSISPGVYRLPTTPPSIWGYPYYATTTLTPVLTFPFTDSDVGKGYTEAPTRREIVIERWNGTGWTAVTGSPFVITTGITDDFTVPGGATLVTETIYRAYARYDDNASVRGPFSRGDFYFRTSTAPVLTRTAPTSGATITNPHPLIDWGITLSGGKVAVTKRIQVYDRTDANAPALLLDTGVIADATSSYQLPAFHPSTGEPYVDTGMVINVVVTVTDTDNLVGTITFDYTNSFTLPVPLVGLALTPDLGSSSVVLAVTASVDPNIGVYRWYRRGLREFDAIADTTVPTYTDYEAPLGVPVDYAATQVNGAITDGESAQISDTTLVAEYIRFWFVHAADASHTQALYEVMRVREDDPFDQGVFQPLPSDTGDAAYPIVRSGQSQGKRVSITMYVLAEDRDQITMLREARTLYRQGVDYSILKSPDGLVWLIRLADIPVDWVGGGDREITFTGIQVA